MVGAASPRRRPSSPLATCPMTPEFPPPTGRIMAAARTGSPRRSAAASSIWATASALVRQRGQRLFGQRGQRTKQLGLRSLLGLAPDLARVPELVQPLDLALALDPRGVLGRQARDQL